MKNIEGKGYGITPKGIEDATPEKAGADANLWSAVANPSLVVGNPNVKVELQDPMGVGTKARGTKKPVA